MATDNCNYPSFCILLAGTLAVTISPSGIAMAKKFFKEELKLTWDMQYIYIHCTLNWNKALPTIRFGFFNMVLTMVGEIVSCNTQQLYRETVSGSKANVR